MRRTMLGAFGMIAGAVAVLAGSHGARAGLALGTGGHSVGSAVAAHRTASRATSGTGTSALPGGDLAETGPAVQTPFGPVQVRVSLSGGRIVDSQAVQTPNFHRRSVMINQYATPILRQETLTAQSANIDLVSGATLTSEAYAQSLQAALDRAPH